MSQQDLSKTEVLHLVDFDGVCVSPGLITVDSLRWKANELLEIFGFPPLSELELNALFTAKTGTTELNFIEGIMDLRTFPKDSRDEFTQMYLIAREAHLRLPNKKRDSKRYGRDLFDSTYPDAIHYFRWLNKQQGNEIESVTGNPKGALKARLEWDTDWKKIFTKKNGEVRGAFGEEAMHRDELILLAIKRAEERGFVVKRDRDGYTTNVIYYGDAPHDFIAGMKSKTRTVFLTRDENKPVEMPASAWTVKKLAPFNTFITDKEVEDAFGYRQDAPPRTLYTTTFYNPAIASYIKPQLWGNKEALNQQEQRYESSFSSILKER